MPLITRRSSTRGTPLGLFGSSGFKRTHCSSLNQNSRAIAISPSTERLNHIQAAMEILFMGLSPRRSAHQGCIVHADRAYDTNRVRDLIEGQRAVPNIPPKRTRL
jgi:hypothetical protein